jgi:toxin ParE1/3/4
MRFEFHPEARLEFRESAAFYEICRPKLGSAFTNEIESVLRQIIDSPNQWPILEEDIRRCLTRRFPYGILYTIETDYILIIAVMHCSRKPGYWRNRLNERPS